MTAMMISRCLSSWKMMSYIINATHVSSLSHKVCEVHLYVKGRKTYTDIYMIYFLLKMNVNSQTITTRTLGICPMWIILWSMVLVFVEMPHHTRSQREIRMQTSLETIGMVLICLDCLKQPTFIYCFWPTVFKYMVNLILNH